MSARRLDVRLYGDPNNPKVQIVIEGVRHTLSIDGFLELMGKCRCVLEGLERQVKREMLRQAGEAGETPDRVDCGRRTGHDDDKDDDE